MAQNGTQVGYGDAPAFPEEDSLEVGNDLQIVARYARFRGNTPVGTAAERNAYTDVYDGLLWSNTTDDTLDRYNGSSWDTVWKFGAGVTYRRGTAYNFGSTPVVVPWTAQDFSSGDVSHSTGTITFLRAGTYLVSFALTCGITGSATRIFAELKRNGSQTAVIESVSSTVARTTLTSGGLVIQASVGTTLTLEAGASSTVAADPAASRNFISIAPIS